MEPSAVKRRRLQVEQKLSDIEVMKLTEPPPVMAWDERTPSPHSAGGIPWIKGPRTTEATL